VKWDIEWWGSG